MFPNLFQLISRRPPPDYELGFVEEVKTVRRRARNPRIERLFLIAWILIAFKSAFVIWAVDHYHIPFNALWVIVPTVVFAGLCTVVYFRRG
jgi:hypothetical protein